jgi:hypothetical protein
VFRVLDPSTAVLAPTTKPPLPTIYVDDELLVRGKQATDGLNPDVAGVLAELGWGVEVVTKPGFRERPNLDIRLVSQRPLVLRLTQLRERISQPLDAWVALQQIAGRLDHDVVAEFELNHVLVPSGGGYWGAIGGGYWGAIGGGYWGAIGGGYWGAIGGGYWGAIGSPAEYGVPGLGGKSPVALVIADPAGTARHLDRPPVVVIPDSGIGVHSWFTPRNLSNQPAAPHTKIEPYGTVTVVTKVSQEIPDDSTGVDEALTGRPAPLAGHGTFIAGIIRQKCPAAHLEAHTTMDSQGVIVESHLIDLLHTLLERQLKALATHDAIQLFDVLSLSAGYYHESAEDTPIDTSIADVLGDLGRAGVLVVAGAGNDATERPFLPAGLAGLINGGDGLPLVSVGSLNPNGTTVSLFSNAGSWVTTYRRGAAIVSTLPRRMNPGAQSSSEVDGETLLTAAEQAEVAAGKRPSPFDRSTIDSDDFSGGFGVWSGTSFATPVVAGHLAEALTHHNTEIVNLNAMLERGRAALADVLSPKQKRLS